jgi:hypothetical protein
MAALETAQAAMRKADLDEVKDASAAEDVQFQKAIDERNKAVKEREEKGGATGLAGLFGSIGTGMALVGGAALAALSAVATLGLATPALVVICLAVAAVAVGGGIGTGVAAKAQNDVATTHEATAGRADVAATEDQKDSEDQKAKKDEARDRLRQAREDRRALEQEINRLYDKLS